MITENEKFLIRKLNSNDAEVLFKLYSDMEAGTSSQQNSPHQTANSEIIFE